MNSEIVESYDKLLKRQLVKIYGSLDNIPEDITPLLALINETYQFNERDRLMMERSIDISSEEFIEINQQLEIQKRKLESTNFELRQFAYASAHDLKEPLRSISSFIQLALMDKKNVITEESSKYFKIAVDGVERLYKILNGLLAYTSVSRDDQSRLSEEIIDNIVNEVKLNLQSIILESDAVIDCDAPVPLLSNNVKMIQLFQNLIENSIKFKKDNVAPVIRIRCTKKRKKIEIIYQDNGIGIPNEYKSQVFDIFKRLNSQTRFTGSGIGLSICKSIVEGHGGTIIIDKNFTDGTKFNISFPTR